MTTISDLASEVGVTKGTVSKALRGRGGISEQTRRRILDAARVMNYQGGPDRRARARAHSGQILFLAIEVDQSPLVRPDRPFGSYLFGMYAGCVKAAERVDESVTLSATTWKDLDEGFVPPPILRNQVDGIIVRGRLNPRLLTWLKSLGLAVVLLDCDDIYPEFSQVRIDHIQGVEAIVQRLDQVGCQKIAVLAGDRQHLNTIERVSALQAALVRRGRWLSQDATFFGDFGGPKAECACRELLDSGYSFDAIVCQSDPIALVALKELTSRGIRVPEDVKLIGFDDFPEASSVSPSLTTVSVPVEELAEIATDLLYDEIRSREAKRRHILCSCELVIRDSC